MISIIHPSRGRPQKSYETISKWIVESGTDNLEVLVGVELSDHKAYKEIYFPGTGMCYPPPDNVRDKIGMWPNEYETAVRAINTLATKAIGDVLIVVSDDTECLNGWGVTLLKEVEGKKDWILKTQDGIQDYIITMPVMDRAYYNRTGYIYHPDFQHLFCDTYLTCVADITGRKLTSSLMFKHSHYSVNGTPPDELHKRNDATWKQGQDTFIRLMKEFTPEERNRIQDKGMKNWLRNHGL